jgi:RNA polymerase sigma-70 factor (ECF subfamily)
MDTAEPTDQELLAAYREGGHPRPISELFVRHLGKVRGMMYQMTLNHADADDLTQEVFIRASRGLPNFNSRSEFATWLHRIAMNCAKSFLMRRSRRSAECLDALPEPAAPCGDRPDLQAAAGEVDERIRSALAQLTPKLRAAIVLTVLQEKPMTEAARIEGCAVATLYWRVHEARRQLKRFLGEERP